MELGTKNPGTYFCLLQVNHRYYKANKKKLQHPGFTTSRLSHLCVVKSTQYDVMSKYNDVDTNPNELKLKIKPDRGKAATLDRY